MMIRKMLSLSVAFLLVIGLLLVVPATASAAPKHPASGCCSGIFVLTVTSQNIDGNSVIIDDPVANFNPTAFISATPVFNPGGSYGGTYENHPIGVWYFFGYWMIFNQDGAAMTLGQTFNVLVNPGMGGQTYEGSPTGTTANIIQVATSSNVAGDWTDLDTPATNNNPNALLLVTPAWYPGAIGGTFDPHPIGVWYHGGRWAIFNQDKAAIPVGAVFNVAMVSSTISSDFNLTIASASNSAGDWTDLAIPGQDNLPSAIVFVTPVYYASPYFGVPGTYDNHNLGVWYHNGTWAVFNQDGAAVPPGVGFVSIVYSAT